jgi:hypothetical protein
MQTFSTSCSTASPAWSFEQGGEREYQTVWLYRPAEVQEDCLEALLYNISRQAMK